MKENEDTKLYWAISKKLVVDVNIGGSLEFAE